MSRLKFLVLPALALVLSACVVAPYPRQVAYGQGSGYGYGQPVPAQNEVYVNVAPPAPYVEVIPVLPFLGAVWISGFWNWQGGRHHWSPGYYDRPRAGYGYRQHSWSQRGPGQWQQNGGGWYRH